MFFCFILIFVFLFLSEGFSSLCSTSGYVCIEPADDLQNALDSVGSGTTILLRAGDHVYTSLTFSNSAATESERIILAVYPSEFARLYFNSGTCQVISFQISQSYFTITSMYGELEIFRDCPWSDVGPYNGFFFHVPRLVNGFELRGPKTTLKGFSNCGIKIEVQNSVGHIIDGVRFENRCGPRGSVAHENDENSLIFVQSYYVDHHFGGKTLEITNNVFEGQLYTDSNQLFFFKCRLDANICFLKLIYFSENVVLGAAFYYIFEFHGDVAVLMTTTRIFIDQNIFYLTTGVLNPLVLADFDTLGDVDMISFQNNIVKSDTLLFDYIIRFNGQSGDSITEIMIMNNLFCENVCHNVIIDVVFDDPTWFELRDNRYYDNGQSFVYFSIGDTSGRFINNLNNFVDNDIELHFRGGGGTLPSDYWPTSTHNNGLCYLYAWWVHQSPYYDFYDRLRDRDTYIQGPFDYFPLQGPYNCLPGLNGTSCDECIAGVEFDPLLPWPGSCTKCKMYNYDSTSSCVECIGNWYDIDDLCRTCLPGYDYFQGCDVCLSGVNYNTSDNCNSCSYGFSLVSGCTQCRNEFYNTSCIVCLEKYDIAMDCAYCLNGTNYNTSNCNYCKNEYSLESDCSMCRNYYDIITECKECLSGYDFQQDCDVCSAGVNFNTSDNCSSCIDGYGIVSDCTECRNFYDENTFCVICLPGYDFQQDCAVCLNGVNYNVTNNCSSCNNDYSLSSGCSVCRNYYDINNECKECLPGYDILQDCIVCIAGEHFNISNNCSSCNNEYDLNGGCIECRNFYYIDSDCAFCLPGYDFQQDCAVCLNGVNYNVSNNCSSCNNDYSLSSSCSVCRNYYDISTECKECLPGYDILQDCNVCSDGEHFNISNNCSSCYNEYDLNSGCAECRNFYDIDSDCVFCLPGYGHFETPVICDMCLKGINYNVTNNCSSCNNDYSLSSICSVCRNYYDINTECKECLPGYDILQDCNVCSAGEHFNISNNCSSCYNEYDLSGGCIECRNFYNEDGYCVICLEGYDIQQDCNVCLNGINYNISDCDSCKNEYSLESDCNVCRNYYDISTECKECLPGYDILQDCNVCSAGEHFNISNNCVSCYNEYDLSGGCFECRNFYDINNDCIICLPEYDIQQDCDVCLNGENYNTSDNCNSCINEYDLSGSCIECRNFYDIESDCSTCISGYDYQLDCNVCSLGSNYDVTTGCSVCINDYDLSSNCLYCRNYYSMESSCTQCISDLIDIIQDCNICVGGISYNVSDFCLTCNDIFLDPSNGCNTCLAGVNYDPDKGCNECINAYNFSDNCEKCIEGYTLSSGCVDCEDHYDLVDGVCKVPINIGLIVGATLGGISGFVVLILAIIIIIVMIVLLYVFVLLPREKKKKVEKMVELKDMSSLDKGGEIKSVSSHPQSFESQFERVNLILTELKMDQYSENFRKAGIVEDDLKKFSEEDAKSIIPEKFPRERFLNYVKRFKKSVVTKRRTGVDRWLIDPELLDQGKVLKSGSFGTVRVGKLHVGVKGESNFN